MTKNLSQKTTLGVALMAGLLMTAPAFGQGDAKKGAEVYEGTCIACHGGSGKGEIEGVPDFTSTKGPLAMKADEVLLDHITNGFESANSMLAMPELGGNEDLTEQDVENVLAYLRATFEPKK
ncbi:hypothetical protein MNBD_ALPHA02-721 [hydrothermal vent metagenome]|uniref:Cytochrome c domain-containing protein n=1 Tax=hydrothermal vent metagenome TaxID=652676 RepID=A0A3B0RQL1_9ZZZZ